jgi:hypothetical protein
MAKKDGGSPLFNVVRRDYYGDPGKQVGSNLSKERAAEYVKDRQQEGEKCSYEIEQAK